MPGLDPIGAKSSHHVSRMRCSASDSEAVHRCSETVAKAVYVTIPGLQRIIPLRFMLRSARDTPLNPAPGNENKQPSVSPGAGPWE